MTATRNSSTRNSEAHAVDGVAAALLSIPVVGVGASAGGRDALQSLLPAIRPGSGLAFVVVQHLDPARNSNLAKLLAKVSAVPVVELSSATTVERDRVYVIPPNTALTLVGDELRLSELREEERGYRTPIDTFFLSLAAARGERAACVILSGTGSDGTIGLRAVKEQGGLTIAQLGAEYDGMMRSAVATGLVDFVLSVVVFVGCFVFFFRFLV